MQPSYVISNSFFDPVIGAYLLNPLKNDYDEESVIEQYDNPDFKPYITLFEKGADPLSDSNREKYLHYLGAVANGLFNASEKIEKNWKMPECSKTCLNRLKCRFPMFFTRWNRKGLRFFRMN